VTLAVSCSRVLSILVRSQLVGAALVSNDELPGHLDGWFPFVPVKGVEDVLILCLRTAPLSTQECVC
jgi:hypothetical protein